MRIISAVLNGINELTDDQQGGVAGIVMNVFQSLIHHGLAAVIELHHPVTLQLQDLTEHLKVDGQHLRHKNRIFFFHLLREEQPSGGIITKFCHYATPDVRMRTGFSPGPP